MIVSTSTNSVELFNHLLIYINYRCVWQTDTGKPVPGFSPDSTEDSSILDETALPRIKLPTDVIQNLRKLCQRPTQTLRPSIRYTALEYNCIIPILELAYFWLLEPSSSIPNYLGVLLYLYV